jgi:iron complex transport system substrate-binding protein
MPPYLANLSCPYRNAVFALQPTFFLLRVIRWTMSLAIVLSMGVVSAVSAQETPRTVVVGGDIAEILAALDATDSLIGRDDTVLYPPELEALPSIGYLRRLTAESVLSLRPQRLIVSADAGPEEVLAQLRASGVSMVTIPAEKRLDAIPDKVRKVAAAVGADERGEALAESLTAQIEALRELPPIDLRGMFLLSHSGMTPMVAGQETGGGGIMQAVGIDNAFASLNGYRPVGSEGLVANQPEVIIATTLGVQALGGEEGVWELPGMSLTPAGRNQRLLVFDDLPLLDFGPRTPGTLLRLRRALETMQ